MARYCATSVIADVPIADAVNPTKYSRTSRDLTGRSYQATAGIWVKTLTGSDSAAALVPLCVFVPTLLAPLAGIVADRVPRRRLLVLVNLCAGSGCCPCWP